MSYYILDMAHVSSLTQHISRLEPDKDAARLSLYNYLKNLCDPSRIIDHELLNGFYKRALSFKHWQENKLALFNETEALVRHFQETTHARLDLSRVLRAQDFQVIHAESLSHVEPIVQKYVAARVGAQEKFKIIRDADFRLVAIVLKHDHSLAVTTFDNNLMLMKGELEPLNADLTLHYTPDLQMHPQMIQSIEVGSHSFARFHVGVEGLRGVFVRGYTFQKFSSLEGGGLNRYPLLFYPLKRLEQFFVDRASDTTYIELVSGLERAIAILSHPTRDSVRAAQAAFERGRLAVEHIYPDYKLLRLLTDLEKTLAGAAGHVTPLESAAQPMAAQTDFEPEGVDLLAKYQSPSSELKDEPWPEIRNLPV